LDDAFKRTGVRAVPSDHRTLDNLYSPIDNQSAKEAFMNFPVWEVAIGGGMLIAIVSVLHVFVSHFGVGGGLFLVISERKAYRDDNQGLLDWLIRHTKFFVLLTVVFGAVSGVAIWFTISLVNPAGTSALIRIFVWGWAIEWLFFFLEITAALMYLYGWKRLDRKTHLWIGWVYFFTAFMSMVVINGIITFMLTPGRWLESGNFWHGFFNPTYFPSLGVRFAFALALAGIYALVTGSRQRDPQTRADVIRWSTRWIIPAFLVLPFLAAWYVLSLPSEVWAGAQGKLPTATRYAALIPIFSFLTFLGALFAYWRPLKMRFAFSLAVLACAFVTMWSFEFVRESVRKPYVIHGYLYSNSIPALAGPVTLEQMSQDGFLQHARWAKHKQVNEENRLEAGREIFLLQCHSCHTVDSYRSIRKILAEKQWDEATVYNQLGGIHLMVNRAMPPFVGNQEEKRALAVFLSSLRDDGIGPGVSAWDGRALFEQHCGGCHMRDAEDPLFLMLREYRQEQVYEMLSDLEALNPVMPPFTGDDAERAKLAEWIKQQF
jgi:mono/diheme cytochrome c family protein